LNQQASKANRVLPLQTFSKLSQQLEPVIMGIHRLDLFPATPDFSRV